MVDGLCIMTLLLRGVLGVCEASLVLKHLVYELNLLS